MKANKVPEKIYRTTTYLDDDKGETLWKPKPVAGAENIEYIRTDAFIEKALKWYCLDCECNDNCKDTKCFFYREYERYLKGGTNALPPKFSDLILNEDGSISDNWCYRHFIKKMQDDFIEKACEWLSKSSNYNEGFIYPSHNGVIDAFVNNFKNYMKGE